MVEKQSELYIANVKQQAELFCYRILRREGGEGPPYDGDRPQQHLIEPGKQIKIPGRLSEVQLKDIIKQHEAYGMVTAKVLLDSPFFHGLVYSFDKPIPGVTLDLAFEHNNDKLAEQAHERREEIAASVASTLDEASGGTLRNLSMKVTERPQGNQEPSIDSEIEVPVQSESDRNRAQAQQRGRTRRQ